MILDTVDRFQKPIRRSDRVLYLTFRDWKPYLKTGTVICDGRIAGEILIQADDVFWFVTKTSGEVVVMDTDDPGVTRFILENS